MSFEFNLGIDCRFWGIAHAGLGRYTRSLVLAMLKLQATSYKLQANFTLFFQGNSWKQDKDLLKNCQIVEVDIPHYSLAEQTKFPAIIDEQKLNLIHYPHFNFPILAKTPFIVTIHDLIKHFYKGREVTTKSMPVYYFKHLAYRFTIAQAIKKSQAIITPSIFTRDQISANYQIPDTKIQTIYEGVSQPYNFTRHPEGIRQLAETEGSRPNKLRLPSFNSIQKKYHLPKPYFVYTGSAYPSKNLPCLLQALKVLNSQIPTTNCQLLIACARNIFWDRLKNEIVKMGLQNSVFLPGKVPDQDLVTLYQNASAFIMPSFLEGFGLPALEAMSTGCPIISSSTGSMPEIYGQHALYFNPDNVDELVKLMQAVLTWDEDKRKQVISAGQKYSQNFTWEKAARETLKVYQQTLDQIKHE